MTGRAERELQHELPRRGLAFQNPTTGQWEGGDSYLSGNVVAKLARARLAARRNPDIYGENARALERVQPKPLQPGEIHAALGSPWIPPRFIEEFAGNIGLDDVAVERVNSNGKWFARATGPLSRTANTKVWGNKDVSAVELLELALNNKEPTINGRNGKPDQYRTYLARDKQKALKAEFESWVWKNQARSQSLAKIYNETFNTRVQRAFDGSYLPRPLPGANPSMGLTVFDFPAEHRRRLRTTNGVERLNKKIQRRTRVVSIFLNEDACLRLITAIVMEISEEWKTARSYLKFEP